ncbi:hypothetical protein H072_7836 [Dactylellina haptotyla CBS 200.50]|uniref:F-box domain-containing protein n=1 Tax=Dactylellina haptotyla (strain CBS 200.50) TaxID=1284197 RepID=S8A6I1_DACHA|nr:hypothetical protein H072_7836 [Dactylellina haptotyla CBS 200.50]
MNILTLPTELQEEILRYLTWDQHFIAALVSPVWASLLTRDVFRRKRYVYDKIDPMPPIRGRVRNWGLRRYLPNDPGPPWQSNSRAGGYLSLHGLLWTESLVVSLVKQRDGRVKRRLYLAVDPGAYQRRPVDLSVLKHAHDGRWGVRSYFEITDSPLLETDTIYFWGDKAARDTSSAASSFLNASNLSGMKIGDSFASATEDDAMFSQDLSPDDEELLFSTDSRGFKVTEGMRKLPKGAPIVHVRYPVRVRTLNPDRNKHAKGEKKATRDIFVQGRAEFEGNTKTPKDRNLSFPPGMFLASIDSTPPERKYPGEGSDCVGDLLKMIPQYLGEVVMRRDLSITECWAVFDSEPAYQYQEVRDPYDYRDPRKNIVLDLTVLSRERKKKS